MSPFGVLDELRLERETMVYELKRLRKELEEYQDLVQRIEDGENVLDDLGRLAYPNEMTKCRKCKQPSAALMMGLCGGCQVAAEDKEDGRLRS